MLLLDKTLQAIQLIERSPPARIIAGALFIAAMVILATVDRHKWPLNLILFVIAFAFYALVGIAKPREKSFVFWMSVAFVTRLAIIFIFPTLSDDIYRFIWDGMCSLEGISPFEFRPSELMYASPHEWTPPPDLFARLNSPEYFSVYPPPSQLIFAVSVLIGAGSWYWSAVIIKVFILVAEAITIWCMFKLLKPIDKEYRVLYYALNPLVIIELTGNAHTEAFMIAALVASVLVLNRSTRFKGLLPGAALFSLATGFKLLPLIALPSLFHRLKVVKSIVWILLTAAFLAVFMLPVAGVLEERTSESLLLYFQNFEFNASLYYLFRWIGYVTTGYNQIQLIGPVLAGLAITGILLYTAFEVKPKVNTWPRAIMFAFLIYLLCSPIVHPWYICTLVAMSVFTYYRFSIVWSGMIFLSYSAYKTDQYNENPWLIAFEYSVVLFILIYEIVFIKNRPLLGH